MLLTIVWVMETNIQIQRVSAVMVFDDINGSVREDVAVVSPIVTVGALHWGTPNMRGVR